MVTGVAEKSATSVERRPTYPSASSVRESSTPLPSDQGKAQHREAAGTAAPHRDTAQGTRGRSGEAPHMNADMADTQESGAWGATRDETALLCTTSVHVLCTECCRACVACARCAPLCCASLRAACYAVHPFIRSFVRSFIHSFFRSFIRSFIHSFIHSFVRSFIRSFVRSFVRSFIHITPWISHGGHACGYTVCACDAGVRTRAQRALGVYAVVLWSFYRVWQKVRPSPPEEDGRCRTPHTHQHATCLSSTDLPGWRSTEDPGAPLLSAVCVSPSPQ